LMGIGPLARWKRSELPDLVRRLRWAFVVAVITALLLPFTAAGFRPLTSVGLMFALWIAGCVVIAVRDMLRGADGRISLRRASLHPASSWGMHFGHLGIVMFIVGVSLSNSYTTDCELRMEIGQQVPIADYTIRFVKLQSVSGPNYDATRGR